ncbi:MAG: HIT domain-containing protein [Nanoarchaeota archaeon]|nr:HIT domain-containing protein [Nanoarchaeota archaeon]
MTLTDEESKKIKGQLLKQLSNFPEDKQEQIKKQVESMTTDQVENFVKQNQLTHLGGECIFCSITGGKTPSFRIGENEENIAVLEINPLSRGHTLIVPKEHSDNIGDSAQELAKEIIKKLKEKFKPKAVQSNEIKIMEHPLIELIPIYGGETERKQATEEELKTLQEEILRVEEPKTEEEPSPVDTGEELFKMPPRIPN